MSLNKVGSLRYQLTNATKKHTASLIFLHGSGFFLIYLYIFVFIV